MEEPGERSLSEARVRLVVFDLDGTLVDASRDLTRAINLTLARLAPGTAPLTLEQVRSFIGDGARKLVERSLAQRRLGLDVEQVLPAYLEAYSGCLLETTRLYPGVVEALDRMGERLLAVLTNKPGGMSRRILAGLGVLERFFRVVGGDEMVRKPDPDGLLRLLDQSGCSAAEAMMVGDSATDVRTARRAGVAVVGVSYGFDPASFAAEPPDALIDDLRLLPALLG